MGDEADRRIAEVVSQILAAGAVPIADRADLGEELAGHLIERTQSNVESGLTTEAALDRAIAEFGGPAILGADLRETYHSRLWVSTIGALLPVPSATEQTPGVIRWIARGGGLFAALSVVLAVVAALSMTPVRAVVVGGSLGLGAAVVWLAAEALRRGQGWGWTVMAWVLTVETVILFTSTTTPTSNFNLSINGLVGFLLLLRMLMNGDTLRTWTRGSAALPRKLAVGVAAVMLAWGIAPFVGPQLADPTQASVGDIDVVASVTCGHDDSFDTPVKTVSVVVDVTWSRFDLLPLGAAKWTEDWGDSIKLHFTDAWLAGGPSLTAVATGEELPQNGAWGLTMPQSFFGAADAGIDRSVMQVGRPVRLTFLAYPANLEDRDYPSEVTVRYAHLDHFILGTRLACGGRGRMVSDEVLKQATSWDLLTGRPIAP